MKNSLTHFFLLNIGNLIRFSIFLLSVIILLLSPIEFSLSLFLINIATSLLAIKYLNKDINDIAEVVIQHFAH